MHGEKQKGGGSLCWLLFSFLCFLLSANLAAAGGLASKIKIAPLSPAFIKYIKSVKNGSNTNNLTTSNKHPLGLIPNPIKLRPHRVKKGELLKSPSLPSKYDLRDYGLVTPVKDQSPYGTCWAFATYGSLESDVLKTDNETYNPSDNETYDFSEDNLVNGVYTHIGFSHSDNAFGFNKGGNIFRSSAYLADGYGPVLESCDPYPNPGKWVQCPRNRYIENIVFLPARANATDNDYLKEAVYEHGAVYTSMWWCDEAYDDNSTTYYYHGQSCSREGGHAVVIVGWDDNMTVPGAPGKGAWIVRNSWSPSWGDSGYFYVSYYDTEFAYRDGYAVNAYFDDKPDINNGNFVIHQYDKFGMDDALGLTTGSTIYGANIFKASNNQAIKAVSLFMGDAPANYVINVYKNCDNVTKIATLTPDAIQRGTIDESGYYTIDLDTPVNVGKGSSFIIEAELTPDNSSECPLGIEEKVSGYSDNATCNKGESFISADGNTWHDLCGLNGGNTTNVCLKAIAVSTSHSPTINSFTADPTSGDAPLDVSFNWDVSDPDNDTLTCTLDFGDGNNWTGNCTNKPQTYTYNNAGNYNATLTVDDGNGGTANKTLTITANQPATNHPPVINSFTADPTSGDAPLDVSFNWDVSDPDNDTLTCTLDFGDGNNWTGNCTNKPQTYTYNNAGNYNATLTVDDGNGGTANKTLTITANQPQPVNHPPTINSFTANPQSGDAPLKVTFNCNAIDPDGQVTAYEWDFDGDGKIDQTTSYSSISYTYQKPGTYNAKVTVVDNDGAEASKTVSITVTSLNQPPVINSFTANPTSGDTPLDVSFNWDVSDPDNDPLTCTLDFGDGSNKWSGACTDKPQTHTYNSAGSYTAKLTVDDGNGGTANRILTITANQPQPVNHPPTISSFTCTPKEGNAPLKVACTLDAIDPDSDPLHYTYMFGDGQSSTENPTTHTYTAVGTYDIKACACDNKGACNCTDEEITVNPNPSPQIQNFTVSPRKGIAPLTVTFGVTATDRTITNYTFDFGDGKTQTTTNSTITHTYSEPGIYSATVSVIDDYDNTVTSDPIQIQVGDRKKTQAGNGTVTAQTKYSQIQQLVSQKPQCQIPEGEKAPYGAISFKLNLPKEATQGTARITFPNSIEGMKVYKYINGQLVDITGQANISGDTLTLTLIDNGQFDQNTQKGIIEDPVILTQKTSQPKPQSQSQSSSGGGGGGCSMSPVPSTGGIFTYLLMLSGLIGLKFRRRE